jgi:hypothetical protein
VIERTARISAIRASESTQRSDALHDAPPTWVPPTPAPGRPSRARTGPYDVFDRDAGPFTPTEAQIFPPTDVADASDLPFLRFAQLGAVVVILAFLGGLVVFRTVLGPEGQTALVAPASTEAALAAAALAPLPSAAPVPASQATAPPPASAGPSSLAPPVLADSLTPPAPSLPPARPLPPDGAAELRDAPSPAGLSAADLPRSPVLATAAVPGAWAPPVRLVDTAIGERASKGRLSAADRTLLEAIDGTHPDYTRSRVWLYDDATARRSLPDRKRYIDQLMRVPDNATNPVYLLDAAEVAIALEDWSTALSFSRKAEQHWARLPSAAAFNRKAMMYEQQATAWYGLFVRSGNKDADDLDQSLRAWQKYREHVSSRDPGLTARADAQIARLSGLGPKVQ